MSELISRMLVQRVMFWLLKNHSRSTNNGPKNMYKNIQQYLFLNFQIGVFRMNMKKLTYGFMGNAQAFKKQWPGSF